MITPPISYQRYPSMYSYNILMSHPQREELDLYQK